MHEVLFLLLRDIADELNNARGESELCRLALAPIPVLYGGGTKVTPSSGIMQ